MKNGNPFTPWSNLVVIVAGGISATLGFMVLVGWYAHTVAWVQVRPEFVPMQYNTALGFLLCGVGLLSLVYGRLRLATACGAVVAAVGLLTLIQYTFGVSLGIDQLLMEHYITVKTSHPGRMAPNTALCFSLTGAALLVMAWSTRPRQRFLVAGFLGSIIVALGAVAFAGYMTGIETAYGWGQLTHMAVHTATGFAVLGFGVIASAWREGSTEETAAPRWLPLPVGIGVVTLAICLWQALAAREHALNQETESSIPEVTLLVGLLMAGLFALSVYLAQTARLRTNELEVANQELENEITERQRAETALQQETALVQLLQVVAIAANDASIIEEALQVGLDRVCAHTGWPVGHVYLPATDASGELAPTTLWHLDNPERFETLRKVTEATRFAPGVGLPGRVLASGNPAWIIDVTKDPNFPRAKLAQNIGVRAGFAFPILVGTEVVAVLEFFSHEAVEPDEPLLEVMSHVGTQLGRVIERKQAEEEIRVLNEDLERRVQDRTAELATVNKELEAFTYSVSHDLRAPLRHIAGFSKILAEEFGTRLDSTAQHYLQRVQEGSRQMGQLVDDLLNLARVGRQELHRQVTGLNSLVEEVLRNLQPEVEGRKIEWQISSLLFADCDPALMKQVFANLLSNAVKYTRPREKAVIEVGTMTQEGQTVIFVRDNGVGFSMKYVDKLFGVFQRLHRQEDFEGTGVGLATVQRILHKHGGRVWAEAELDKGASFYFTLGDLDESGPENKTTPTARGES